MKRIIILLLFSIYLSFSLSAQEFKNVPKKLTGTMSIGTEYGRTFKGNKMSFSLIHFKSRYHQDIGFYFENGNVDLTDYNIVGLQYGRDRVLFNKSNVFYISIGLKTHFSYEMLRNEILDDKKSAVSLGLSGHIDLEYFITKRISINVAATQNYRYNSVIGSFYPAFTVGLRYNL